MLIRRGDSRDADIRGLLLASVRSENTVAAGLVVEEFALHGGTNRADVAVLAGLSHGYEIKSDTDNLLRFPAQVAAYNAIFEKATLVTTAYHLMKVMPLVPKWWGIIEYTATWPHPQQLHIRRQAEHNPSPDSESIACLLWRPEALALLESLSLDRGVRSKPMGDLAKRLGVNLPPGKLWEHVRVIIRARGDWKTTAPVKRVRNPYESRKVSAWSR